MYAVFGPETGKQAQNPRYSHHHANFPLDELKTFKVHILLPHIASFSSINTGTSVRFLSLFSFRTRFLGLIKADIEQIHKSVRKLLSTF